MTSEKSIMNLTLVDVSALPDTMAYRQNTGQAWQGDVARVEPGEYIRVEPGMKILRKARPVSFGVVGGGDIVGARKGRPFQIETKTLTGAHRTQQITFGENWEKRGGIYIMARSPESAIEQLLTKIP